MDWEICIEEAKEELGITGWTDNWDEVILLAKEKYWSGENFKLLKEETINNANGECELCNSKDRLTAHHIYYEQDITVCLCKKCHSIVHKIQNTYGFVCQLTMSYLHNPEEISNKFPNLYNICMKVRNKIVEAVEYE